MKIFIKTIRTLLATTSLFTSVVWADYCPPSETSFKQRLDVKVKYDPKTKLYKYEYTVYSDPSSILPINRIMLEMKSIPVEVKSPMRWFNAFYPALDESENPPATYDWGTSYSSETPKGGQVGVPDYAIKPGKSLSGFSFKSPNPPAPMPYYMGAFRDIPIADYNPNNPDPDLDCPDEEDLTWNRSFIGGMTIGPAEPGIVYVPIRLRKKGGKERCGPLDQKKLKQLSVVVLSTKSFDVTQLDLTTLRFGPRDAKPVAAHFVPHAFGKLHDEDDQEDWEKHAKIHKNKSPKRKKLHLVFNVKDMGIDCLIDNAFFLRGKTMSGQKILGGVKAKYVGCERKKPGRRAHIKKHSK